MKVSEPSYPETLLFLQVLITSFGYATQASSINIIILLIESIQAKTQLNIWWYRSSKENLLYVQSNVLYAKEVFCIPSSSPTIAYNVTLVLHMKWPLYNWFLEDILIFTSNGYICFYIRGLWRLKKKYWYTHWTFINAHTRETYTEK